MSAPAPVSPPIDPGQLRALLRARIGSFTCSSRWTDDLAELIGDREAVPKSVAAVKRVLSSAKAYPPGGSRTSMLLCPACDRWTPRNQGEGSSEICLDCHYGRKAPKNRELHTWTHLPSSPRFDQPQPIDHVRQALAEVAVRLRIRKLSAMRQAEVDGRSWRRPLYLRADPRICGGVIDEHGVMQDPWLGPIELRSVVEEMVPDGAVADAGQVA